MNNKSKIISILFLLGGLGIIIASFFLFLKEYQEEKLFYLNMIVTCLVFSFISIRTFDIFGSVGNVSSSGAGFGLKWTGIWIYTPIALTVIVLSIVLGLSFRFCIIVHLILLFILLIYFFMGNIVKENINESVAKVEARKIGLKELSNYIDLLEISCKIGAGVQYIDSVNAIRENVRFITASENPVAISIEEKLSSKIQLIASQIEHNSQSSETINDEFKECMALIELRKSKY